MSRAGERLDENRSALLALGFGTAVAMWWLGYLARLPRAQFVPAWLLAAGMLALMVAGGCVAGRWGGRGWSLGARAGLLTAVLNLLILGSLLGGEHPNQIVPAAVVWVPGSLVLGAVLGGAGAAFGARGAPARPEVDWRGAFGAVAAVATLLLVVVGGLVTSKQAGLAVVDWPNSFGYNMFLYPLSRMSGGVYYEHAHRLFGSLVGLTTLVLAVHLHRVEERRWVRRLSLVLLAVVIVQGILGGLRVTGGFTWSTSPEDMAPSTALAVVHGVLGQLFFGSMVALAVFVSRGWRRAVWVRETAGAQTDRVFAGALVFALVVQLVLGAVQRHTDQGLMIHITMAALVVGLGLSAGVRAWGLYGDVPVLSRLGTWLLSVLGVQVLLGIGALIAVTARAAGSPDRPWQVAVTTAHQTTGALLLATTVLLLVWLVRLVRPAPVEA